MTRATNRSPWAPVAAMGSLLPVLLGGCTTLDLGLQPGAEGSPASASSSTGAADEPPTSASTADPAMTSTGETTDATDPAQTTGPDINDGEVLEQDPCRKGSRDLHQVCVQAQRDGDFIGVCGGTLELWGITQPGEDGRWLIEDCGACRTCDGLTYALEFTVPEGGWEPDPLPLCSRISIDFAPVDDSEWSCAFHGLAIWDNDEYGEEPAPVYIATSVSTDPPAAVPGLQVTKSDMCNGGSCCGEMDAHHRLTWSGAAMPVPIELEDKDQLDTVDAFDMVYAVLNNRSHTHENGCYPHFDWIFRRTTID